MFFWLLKFEIVARRDKIFKYSTFHPRQPIISTLISDFSPKEQIRFHHIHLNMNDKATHYLIAISVSLHDVNTDTVLMIE